MPDSGNLLERATYAKTDDCWNWKASAFEIGPSVAEAGVEAEREEFEAALAASGIDTYVGKYAFTLGWNARAERPGKEKL